MNRVQLALLLGFVALFILLGLAFEIVKVIAWWRIAFGH